MDDALDRQAFFEVMASFPTGVAVVTTVDAAGIPRGLTTTAVCSVSADPPTLLVSIAHASRTLDAVRGRGSFVVNFVGDGRTELCLRFASKVEDKFEGVAWQLTGGGVPLLHEDAIAWAECTVACEVDVADHSLVVGKVVAGGLSAELEAPLLYYRRSWGSGRPRRSRASPSPSRSPPSTSAAATCAGRASSSDGARCRIDCHVSRMGYSRHVDMSRVERKACVSRCRLGAQ